MKILHDSHLTEYREPFGAVAVGAGCQIALAVWDEDPDEGDWVSQAQLRLWRDDTGELLLPMQPKVSATAGRRLFVANVPPQMELGLVWYYFILRTGTDDLLFYGNNADGLGGVGSVYTEQPKSYQLTVYAAENTPDWFKQAVCYQIFTDRFARGDNWQACQQRAHTDDWQGPARVVQQSWRDTPFYSYDEAGRVTRWPFFGGNLQGIKDKLLYLKSLGVTAVYLNPIFRAASNHKYDTADYRQIDPAFGTEEDFAELAAAAGRLGIKLILDGVFSHTGDDSRYFNRLGNYPDLGAYQSEESLYYGWYKFKQYPDDYAAWWGVQNLPEVDKNNESYRRFIYGADDSVVPHWLELGAAGWRLDVADELPDDFIDELAAAAKANKPDALILGEVWEDASNKVSYGRQRSYLWGGGLDAVMNYPFRTALFNYLLGSTNAAAMAASLLSLKENYPPEHFAAAYDLIGSHDTVRALTALAGVSEPQDKLAAEHFSLSAEEKNLGRARLKLAALLQFTMQGVPAVYYGDEAGVQGFSDPFNRATYPWGAEDAELLAWYRGLSRLRSTYPLLVEGEFWPYAPADDVYACRRYWADAAKREQTDGEEIWVLVNRANSAVRVDVPLAEELVWGRELLSGIEVNVDGNFSRELPPLAAEVWLLTKAAPKVEPMERAAGVLCHLGSLPAAEGGWPSACRRFIDYLAMAGFKLWQLLPLNPTGESLSPYTPMSVFAGDDKLAAELVQTVDWNSVPIMEYMGFCTENAYWLEDYALFAAISRARAGLCWQRWPKAERDRLDLPRLKTQYADEMEQVRREQFLFWREWDGVKAYAAHRGIKLVGDMPIYPAPDSADVWANRELFWLDADGYPELVAGVPPDNFAAEGQCWGNPLYNWEANRKEDYDWWLRRFKAALGRYDYLRVDHFRAFAACYAIPKGQTAKAGYWLAGPGYRLFRAAEQQLGRLPLLAENLGFLDNEVANLLRLAAYPGMAVYQFAADELAELDLTDRVLYTGTHDNQTLCAWLMARGGVPAAEGEAELIGKLYQTAAPWVIIPLQDMLGLGDEARMNIPGVAEGNWRWQADWQQLKLPTAAKFNRMIKAAGR